MPERRVHGHSDGAEHREGVPAVSMKQPQPTRSGPSAAMIVWGVVIVLAIVFIAQNTHTSRINLLFWDIRGPAWVWLVVIFGAGFLTGFFVPRLWSREDKGRGKGRD
jgi:uncharacterized integral membrane protein